MFHDTDVAGMIAKGLGFDQPPVKGILSVVLLPTWFSLNNSVTLMTAQAVGKASAVVPGMLGMDKDAAKQAGCQTVLLAAGGAGFWVTANVAAGVIDSLVGLSYGELNFGTPIGRALAATASIPDMLGRASDVAAVAAVANWVTVYHMKASNTDAKAAST